MGVLIFDQPKTPYGATKAKSRALVMIYERGTGVCIHVRELFKITKTDWHRRRSWYLPWGDAKGELRRICEVLPMPLLRE